MKTKTSKPIHTLAIANRGEVAVRIIRACQEMGIQSLLLHSEADQSTRAYRMADKKVCIGPAPIAESYLSIERTLQGALAGGADGLHPGFGFLSENADFADACTKAGLIFVGPSGESIRTLGDKIRSKEIAQKLQIPLVPSYQGDDQKVERLIHEAEQIGFPVIVKAAAGGGGRGMKLILTRAEAQAQIESAQREAQAAFGSGRVFLEKYLGKAKHIEFQIFGDASGSIQHLYERECSVQRRHQKIIEEATSPSLTPELRIRMAEAAVKLVEAVGYQGAGTLEFLLQENKFYFMEMNTRLQVEHPVTEMVMGVDLVKAQILTAQGLPLPSNWSTRTPQGHSIECRLYAENPYLGGVPSTGLLGAVLWPEAHGRRFEYGFEEGDQITSHYDSMIAKVIVWDETRSQAIEKMIRVLQDSVVFGVHTNTPLLIEILNHPEFQDGTMTTRFFDTHFSEPIRQPEPSKDFTLFMESALKQLKQGAGSAGHTALRSSNPFHEFWRNV